MFLYVCAFGFILKTFQSIWYIENEICFCLKNVRDFVLISELLIELCNVFLTGYNCSLAIRVTVYKDCGRARPLKTFAFFNQCKINTAQCAALLILFVVHIWWAYSYKSTHQFQCMLSTSTINTHTQNRLMDNWASEWARVAFLFGFELIRYSWKPIYNRKYVVLCGKIWKFQHAINLKKKLLRFLPLYVAIVVCM